MRNVWTLASPISRFKNIILDEKLSNKLRNNHENFSNVRVSMVSNFLLGS
jgi:hypothetical protein